MKRCLGKPKGWQHLKEQKQGNAATKHRCTDPSVPSAWERQKHLTRLRSTRTERSVTQDADLPPHLLRYKARPQKAGDKVPWCAYTHEKKGTAYTLLTPNAQPGTCEWGQGSGYCAELHKAQAIKHIQAPSVPSATTRAPDWEHTFSSAGTGARTAYLSLLVTGEFLFISRSSFRRFHNLQPS